MKKMILTTIITTAVLGLMGCNPQKSTARSATTRTANASGQISGSYTNTTCMQNTSTYGAIFDQTGNSFNFESRVKGLLSATIDPNEVGSISSSPNESTGVRFQGTIRLDSNGNVNLSQTSISIKVYDSYVLQSAMDGTNQYQPIPIEFSQATAGQFNMQTGAGYVVFRDQYGDIRLDGTITADNFSGYVSFSNTSNITGGAAAAGQLGQFYIARCAIIK